MKDSPNDMVFVSADEANIDITPEDNDGTDLPPEFKSRYDYMSHDEQSVHLPGCIVFLLLLAIFGVVGAVNVLKDVKLKPEYINWIYTINIGDWVCGSCCIVSVGFVVFIAIISLKTPW